MNPEGTIRESNDGRLRSQTNTAEPYRTLGDPDGVWHHDFEDARAAHLARILGDQDGLCIRALQLAKSWPMPANLQNGFSWDDVRVFLALFRARTLSRAAVRLGVNASTVGRRLDALEGALGARLFDRTPDGVAPTAATEHLLGHAERLEHGRTPWVVRSRASKHAPRGWFGSRRRRASPMIFGTCAAATARALSRHPSRARREHPPVGFDSTRGRFGFARRQTRER